MKQGLMAALLAATGMAAVTSSAVAYEAGDWVVKLGMTSIDPDQTNGRLSGLGDAQVIVAEDTQLTFTGTYMLTPAWGIELLASLPFEHDFTVGGAVGGSTRHLPPTLSAQYHFNSGGQIIPYLGLGLNYTLFFSEKAYGDLDGIDVNLDDSFGIAVQAGVAYMINERLLINVDIRYIDIEADIKINGTEVGTVKIDPMTVGMSVGYRF